VLQYPEEQLHRIAKNLREEEVAFDLRRTGIRLSPHIYNDGEEIDAVAACLV